MATHARASAAAGRFAAPLAEPFVCFLQRHIATPPFLVMPPAGLFSFTPPAHASFHAAASFLQLRLLGLSVSSFSGWLRLRHSFGCFFFITVCCH